jgi:hypothetical protein
VSLVGWGKDTKRVTGNFDKEWAMEDIKAAGASKELIRKLELPDPREALAQRMSMP